LGLTINVNVSFIVAVKTQPTLTPKGGQGQVKVKVQSVLT